MRKIALFTILAIALLSAYILVSKSLDPNPNLSDVNLSVPSISKTATNKELNQPDTASRNIQISNSDPALSALPSDWTTHDDGFSRYYNAYVSSEYKTSTVSEENSDTVEVVILGGRLEVKTSPVGTQLNDPIAFSNFSTSCKLSSVMSCSKIEIDGILSFRSEHKLGLNQENSYTYLQSVHNSTLYDFKFFFADSFDADDKEHIIDSFIQNYKFRD